MTGFQGKYGIVLLMVVLLVLLILSCARRKEMYPSLDKIITNAWKGYKTLFINENGRVIRPSNNYDTVSEGQAYAMLMAVWMDDRETFERIYKWAEGHLSRKERFGDNLLAWHWDVKKGILDWNSASDADQDYALALILAYENWGNRDYFEKAKSVLNDILRLETAVASDKMRYLLPGTWGDINGTYVINPSYFSPAWYKIFFRLTKDSRWIELVETSYHTILKVSKKLANRNGVGLVPDWCAINEYGEFIEVKELSSLFGWDAIRISWRIGIDFLWFREDRAKQYLKTLYQFYTKEWERHGEKFFAQYSYDGSPVEKYESVAAYAMSLGCFSAMESSKTNSILDKIRAAYKADGYFDDKNDYYLNSLTLLGLMLIKEPSFGVEE